METQVTPKTEKDHIRDAIFKVWNTANKDSDPSTDFIDGIENELYENLFGYRDRLGERPLNRPVKFSLEEIFKELKFGRMSEDQRYLDKCIYELEIQEKVNTIKNILNDNNVIGYEIKVNDNGTIDIKGQLVINK
jgi:hypothetical protein